MVFCVDWRSVPWCHCRCLQTGSDRWCHWMSQPAPGKYSGKCGSPLSYECPTANIIHGHTKTENMHLIRLTAERRFSIRFQVYYSLFCLSKLNGSQNSHLDCPVIAAGADELGSSAGRVAGVNEGSVALQTLDPLTCFTIPHTYSLVCAGWKQHAEKHRENSQLVNPLFDTFTDLLAG